LRKAGGAVLLAALLAACVPDEAPETGTAPPAEPSRAAASLPEEVAGFSRATLTPLSDGRRGVSAEYAGPSRAAVATVELTEPEQPPGSVQFAEAVRQAVAEAIRAAEARTQLRLREAERTEITAVPGTPVSCVRLTGLYGRQPVANLVCLGAPGGRLLRVELFMPDRGQIRPVDPLPFVIGLMTAAAT
jgi:hypothetical protein